MGHMSCYINYGTRVIMNRSLVIGRNAQIKGHMSYTDYGTKVIMHRLLVHRS